MGKMNIYNSMKRRIAGALVFLALSGGSLFAQSGFRYPYLVELTDGTNDVCVIVSRDGKGGVKENLLRKAGDPAPDGTESGCRHRATRRGRDGFSVRSSRIVRPVHVRM